MNATRLRLVDDYLKELDRSLAGLPSARRKEIVAEIEEHIYEQLSELDQAPTDSQMRNLLDRVGDPHELAVEARERFDIPVPEPRWTDYLALLMLPFGGLLIPFIGWLAGVALLWSSRVWSDRDKLLGTLIVPGGLLLAVLPDACGYRTGRWRRGTGSRVAWPDRRRPGGPHRHDALSGPKALTRSPRLTRAHVAAAHVPTREPKRARLDRLRADHP